MAITLKRQVLLVFSSAVLTTLMLTGCERAASPSAVAKDVSAAEQKDAARTAQAREDAARDVDSAQQKVDEKAVDRDNVAAKDSYKVAIARADGAHDTALQQCKGLAGDTQRRCKDQADADYDAAKANAKALEVSRRQ